MQKCKTTGYVQFCWGGVNKVHYGRCEIGEYTETMYTSKFAIKELQGLHFPHPTVESGLKLNVMCKELSVKKGCFVELIDGVV